MDPELTEAESALERGEYGKSLALLEPLANKYPNHVINGSMLELALRMILMSEGSLTTLHMLGATVANLVEKGAMIEAYMKSDNELDESDWLKNGSLVKPTIH